MLNCQECGAANKDDAVVCRQCGVKLNHREISRAFESAAETAGKVLVRKPVKAIKKTGRLVWRVVIFILVAVGFALAAAAVSLFDKLMWPDYPEKVELTEADRKETGKIYTEFQKKPEKYLNILEINRIGNYLLYDAKGNKATLKAGAGKKWAWLLDGGTVNFNAKRRGDVFEFVFYGRVKYNIPYRLRFVFDAVRPEDGKLKLYHATLGSLPLWGADAGKVFEDFTEMLGPQGKKIYQEFSRVRDARMMLHSRANDTILFDMVKEKGKEEKDK